MSESILTNLRAVMAFVSEERENRGELGPITEYAHSARDAETSLDAAIIGVEKAEDVWIKCYNTMKELRESADLERIKFRDERDAAIARADKAEANFVYLQDASFALRWLAGRIEEVGTQAEWAKRNGFSAAYVSDVMRGRREISDKMAEAIGFRRVVKFEPIRPS